MEQLKLVEPLSPKQQTATSASKNMDGKIQRDLMIVPKSESKGYLFAKRLFDVAASLTAILVLSPLLLLVAALVKLDSKGPALYVSQRVGKDNKLFKMYKFRSMCPDAEAKLKDLEDKNEVDGPVFKIARDPRVTAFGSFIRRYSIDELPQLFNILKGDMSVVGPRPPLPSEVKKYTPYQLQRLQVTPGLTCYWQCRGRSNLSFDDWVALDLQYIQERSVLTDLKIIFLTIPAVCSTKGAY